MAALEPQKIVGFSSCALLLFLSAVILVETAPYSGKLYPGFQGSPMSRIDNNGLFLLSKNSNFAFGFQSYDDPTSFSLVIVYLTTKTVVWSANPDIPVSNSDMFVFNKNGTAFLQKDEEVIWSTGSSREGVSAFELRDTGNLVLLGSDNVTVWESFGHPTDTLLSDQDFAQGMRLVSRAKSRSSNLSYALEIDSGDMVLYAGYGTRQPYWSMGGDSRKIINKGGVVSSALIHGNSWMFYDQNRTLVWQFLISGNSGSNVTWVAVLGGDGSIMFSELESSINPSPTRIPFDPCQTPEPCDPYMVCYSNNKCKCLPALSSRPSCGPGNVSACDAKPVPGLGSTELVSAGDGIGYFALGFVPPTMKSNLSSCKSSCLGNCSCLALFFESGSGNCFLFDKIGSLQTTEGNSSGFTSYIKVASTEQNGEKNRPANVVVVVVVVALVASLIIVALLYAGYRYLCKGDKTIKEGSLEDAYEEEDDLLEGLSGGPTRFSYKELEVATKNFTVKLGSGGFGSVYHGTLPDGTQVAVKQLERIGQGKKEFRSEVSIIGSIHHVHLVRLKGFCAEGSHRLLAYEYMSKGSLDKWIFRRKKMNNEGKEEEQEKMVLPWETRYQVALGTAKGLAYLHEDCDSKIVHCDIKPENVLLDENFLAKVSDFGLAKLMDREQSNVFTTLRGTRGYLAPEWITNHAISEKSDVYSYGIVLLELIGGRKNFDPEETSEKSHLPSYAFKMMEEGKLKQVLDASLKFEEKDERIPTAIKVALWCVQEDMSLRPNMGKVVQMLEGVSPVPRPPVSSPLVYRLNARLSHLMINENTSSGTSSDRIVDSYLSDVQLSGPR